MCKAYNCLPTDLWPDYDPGMPSGFYLNRGVFYFGRLIENEQAEAESRVRKNRKHDAGVDRLVMSARLAVLEKRLGVPVKRHKDPGAVSNTNPFQQHGAAVDDSKDEVIRIKVD